MLNKDHSGSIEVFKQAIGLGIAQTIHNNIVLKYCEYNKNNNVEKHNMWDHQWVNYMLLVLYSFIMTALICDKKCGDSTLT